MCTHRRKKLTEAAKKRYFIDFKFVIGSYTSRLHSTYYIVPSCVIVVRCAILLVSLNWRYSFYFRSVCRKTQRQCRRRCCACVIPKPISCRVNATMCFRIMLVIFGYSFNPFGVSFASVCLHNHSHHCNFHAVISLLKGFICNLICTVDRKAKWWRRMNARINSGGKHVVNSFLFDFSSSWNHFLVLFFTSKNGIFGVEMMNIETIINLCGEESIMFYLNVWMLWNFLKALRQFKLYTIMRYGIKGWKKFLLIFQKIPC